MLLDTAYFFAASIVRAKGEFACMPRLADPLRAPQATVRFIGLFAPA